MIMWKLFTIYIDNMDLMGPLMTREKCMPKKHVMPHVYNLHEGSPSSSIIFTINDETSSAYKDSLVITLWVGSYDVCMIFVDTGSSVDLIFLIIMKALEIKDNDIIKKEFPLVGFNGNITYVIGILVLPVMVRGSIVIINFVVIDVLTHYDAILRRPWVYKIRAIPSTIYQVNKYHTKKGIREIKGDQKKAKSCYNEARCHKVATTIRVTLKMSKKMIRE